MSSVTARPSVGTLLRRTRRSLFTGRDERGTQIRWGIAGIVVVIVLVAAVGVINVIGTSPERTYSADIAEAGSIRTGDDVRVAGVPVGKVKSLELLPDRVRMTFTVRDGVAVGDQTTLAVRMLTLVGGYYLAVQPAGSTPLGHKVIPAQRVILPYNLTQAFQDAVDPVRRTDADVIRQDVAALSASIDKSPDAVRNAVRALGDIVAIMDKQNADVSQTLSLADEYLTALNRNSDTVATLMRTFGTLENIVADNREQLSWALHGLARLVQELVPIGRIWDDSLRERAKPLVDGIPKLQELGDRMGTLLDSLRTFEQRLTPLVQPGGGLTVDQSAATAADVCVPVPGGGC
ncbi:Mce family protein MceC [Nocardia nova SH22a]|uniref:Mce family protein MceC n=1 Tax=Nocardia nova SH22a TaxID=1415166 RepID=W5TK72_9NOCA|nr:MlaD family protein [Nocardia nova]AHH19564.1 Mce family protein MceC [Nocardia nova SH22a]